MPSTAKALPKPAKKPRTTYDPEQTYHYYKHAGGNIQQAMKDAKGDKKVPKDRNTWSSYLKKFNFDERLQKDTEEEWEALD